MIAVSVDVVALVRAPHVQRHPPGARPRATSTAAEVVGASTFHIVFREILPNCAAPIVTKMTLDLGFVILLGSSLSFLGLGVQPPTPDLGSMVAEGAKYLPDLWWLAVFPGVAILVVGARLQPAGRRRADLLDVER